MDGLFGRPKIGTYLRPNSSHRGGPLLEMSAATCSILDMQTGTAKRLRGYGGVRLNRDSDACGRFWRSTQLQTVTLNDRADGGAVNPKLFARFIDGEAGSVGGNHFELIR